MADDLILVFDTETTGLPLWHEPSDAPGQPHVVSLAAELCAPDGTVLETYNEVVKIGVPILPETTAIHGITDAIANEIGLPPEQVLGDFLALVDRASIVIGHNVSFDKRMIRIMSARVRGEKWECPKPSDCTMWMTAKALKVKKPSLTDATHMLFGEKLDNAHNALADCRASRRIYFRLMNEVEPHNPRVRLGDNQPPAEEPEAKAEPEDDGLTEFQRVEKEILDLYAEARNWLDGAAIASDAQAAEVGKLRDMIRDAAKRAEELRKAEAKPFDDGKAEVQARYNPLVQKDRGKCDLAIKTCNDALKPWLKKIDDDQREQARKQQAEALALANQARDAAIEASKTTDIGQRESAEELLSQAKSALGSASKAQAARPQVAGATRAIGLKSVWRPELVDPAAAIEHFRKTRPGALKEWMIEQAKAEVRAGVREIPGFAITEDRVPV